MENISLLKERYYQMKDGYNFTYPEWQNIFTDKLKPFRAEWDDTTAVTMLITSIKLPHLSGTARSKIVSEFGKQLFFCAIPDLIVHKNIQIISK